MPPTNWKPFGLGRKIIINKDGASEYTYEDSFAKCSHPKIAIDCNNRVIDLFGNSVGTWNGTKSYSKGKIDNGLSFNNTDYVTMSNESLWDFIDRTTEFSIAFWCKAADTGVNQMIIGKQTALATSQGWGFYFNSAENLQFSLYATGIGEVRTRASGFSFSDGLWHHVVMTKSTGTGDYSEFTWYIDGVNIATSSIVNTLTSGSCLNNELVALGAESDGGNKMQSGGGLEHLLFYDYELTPAQALDIYNGQNPWGSVSKTTPALEFNANVTIEQSILDVGINGSHGAFGLVMDDSSSVFIDTSTTEKKSSFKRTWPIEVWMGKTPSGMYRAFKGTIQSARVTQSSTGVIKQRIFAIGEKEKTTVRMSTIKRVQDKTTGDADTLDTTDTRIRLSELAKDLLEDVDHYANSGATPLTFTTNGIELIDIKLPDFQKNFISVAQAWEEIANIANCYYGIDSASDAFMWIKGTKESSLLITNDVDNAILNNWNPRQYSTLETAPNWYEDSIVGGGYSIIHGLGYLRTESDQKFESANTAFDLNTNWVAVPFTPQRDNVSVIAPFLAKNATVTDDLIVELVEQDIAPDAGEPSSKIKARVVVPKERLDAELDGTGKYFEIPFPKVIVVPDTKYFVVIQKYPTASILDWDYQATTGTAYTSSTGADGSWSSNTHNFKFREYGSKTTRIVAENVEAKKAFGERETVFPLNEYTHKDSAIVVLSGISEAYGRENRTFPAMVISPPDKEIKVGQTCRITDVGSGMDMVASIVSYSITWDANDPDSNLGARHINVIVEKLSYA